MSLAHLTVKGITHDAPIAPCTRGQPCILQCPHLNETQINHDRPSKFIRCEGLSSQQICATHHGAGGGDKGKQFLKFTSMDLNIYTPE
jgi:hypothetical protein